MKNPNKEELQELYNSGELIKMHQKMILAIAHKIHERYPAESYDELVSEGYWGIVKGIPKYDPEKSTITTWLYQAAYYQMLSFCTNPVTHRDVPTPEEDPIFERAEEESWLSVFLRGLGEDAELLITAILEAPGELSEVIRNESPRNIRRAITKQLKRTLGYSTVKWNRVWQEIKTNL